MPDIALVAAKLPSLPSLTASSETIELGRELFDDEECSACHGKQAVARLGGTVPDLRYATIETHAQWNDIVIDGTKSDKGMRAFDISVENAEAIRAYVLSRAYKLQAESP